MCFQPHHSHCTVSVVLNHVSFPKSHPLARQLERWTKVLYSLCWWECLSSQRRGYFFSWICNSYLHLRDRHLPWLSGTTWQQQSCNFNRLQVVFTERSLKNSPRRDHQAEWSPVLDLLAGRTGRLISLRGWTDMLSDRPLNPISYLSEGELSWVSKHRTSRERYATAPASLPPHGMLPQTRKCICCSQGGQGVTFLKREGEG